MAQTRQQQRQQQRRDQRQAVAVQPPRRAAEHAIESGTDISTLPLDRALDAYTPNLMALLGNDPIKVEHFKRVVITALNINPELAAGDRRTLFNACSKAAHDGLMPDGNEAALVLYRGTKIKNRYGQEERIDAVQYMPMVAGIKKRLWNSGFVSSLTAAPIYKNDHFRFERIGTKQILEHRPAPLDQEAGEIVGAYALIELNTGGEPIIDVMRKSEIEKSRAQSKNPNSFGWEKFFGQMACKTVLRRCAKGAPQTAMLQQLLDRDEEAIDPGADRQLIEEARPQIADYRPGIGAAEVVDTKPTRTESTPSPPPPPPEPTLEVVDAVGEITDVAESGTGEALLALFDAAAKIKDRGEARRAVETLAQNNQGTILALKGKRSEDADRVVARYRELSSELDPFGLPGNAAKSPPAASSAKTAAEPTAAETASAASGSPAETRQRPGPFPALERFPDRAPNWPKFGIGVVDAIRRASSRSDLAEINHALGPFRQGMPDTVRTDIDVALDDRSREV